MNGTIGKVYPGGQQPLLRWPGQLEGGQLGGLGAFQRQQQAGILPAQAYQKLIQQLGMEQQRKGTALTGAMSEAEYGQREQEFEFKKAMSMMQLSDLESQVGSILGNYLIAGLGQAIGGGLQQYGQQQYQQQLFGLLNPQQQGSYIGMQVGSSYPRSPWGYGGMGQWGSGYGGAGYWGGGY